MSDLLTAQQVQERFGLSRQTLLRYEQSGLISDAIKRTPGGQRRYDANAIMRSMEANTVVEKPVYKEFGNSGLSRWGGHVDQTNELTELQGRNGLAMFREMRLNDPIIAAIFFGIENSMKQATPRFVPASESDVDKEVAKFMDEALHDMSFSFNDTMDFICDCLTVGVAPLEIVYKKRLGPVPSNYTADAATSQYNDGLIGWRKWALRPVDTLAYGNEWLFDEHGAIQGINQETQNGGNSISIPIEKLLLFRTTVAPFNSPLPPPIHRAAYIPYYYSKNFQEIEGIGVERDLGGIPVIYLGNDCNVADFNAATQMAINLRRDEQAGIVIPHAKMGDGAIDGQGMLVELLGAQNARPHDVGMIIERYDKRKAMTVLAQFIMLGMDRFGSFALSKTQSDLFTIAITAWLNKFADVINMYAIPRLLRYNKFVGMTGYPKLRFSTVGVPDLTGISTFINTMVGREVITPDPELERHMRHVAGLPEPQPVTIDDTGNNAPKRKPTGETALLIRRILLALKELPNYESLSDETLFALIDPLLQQLRVSIQHQSGLAVPPIDISGDRDKRHNDDINNINNVDGAQLEIDVDNILNQLKKEKLIEY